MSVLETVLEIFGALIKGIVGASGDAAAEEEALMEAEARIARARAERKFQ